MLAIFRTNQVIYSIFLLAYIIVIRSSFFFVAYDSGLSYEGLIATPIIDWFSDQRILEGVFTIFLVFGQSLYINYVISEHRLLNENTLFPGWFYAIAVSALPEFLPLSSILLANTFLIFALDNILQTYRLQKCMDAVFNVGWWIGVAALFYNAFIFYIFLAWIGLGIVRTNKLKDRLALLCGFVLPFIFASTWFFWNDQLGVFWSHQVFAPFDFLDFQFVGGTRFYFSILLLAILFILGLFNGYPFDKNNKVRNFIAVYYWCLLISGITFFFHTEIRIHHFLISMIPLSLLLASRFLSFKSNIAELTHFFLIIGVFLIQFRDIIGF